MSLVRRAGPLAIAWVSVLAGCTLGPDYRRPAIEMPSTYRALDGFASDAGPALADATWWAQWNDPVLARLVSEALAANLDVAAAVARVDRYYGVLGSARAQLLPQVGGEFTGARNRASERGVAPAPAANPYTAYQADLFVSWEIDLFGRLRRLSEAARAEYLAADAARQGVLLAVASATAGGYVSLRDLDYRLLVARRTLQSRQEALALFEKRFKGGVISELELSQARAEYATALRAVPRFEQAIAEQEHALSVLLGRNPGPIARGLPIDEMLAPAIPAGLPSELLERRPDLRQAEQALVAANARIGAAKALYFPRISLTGVFGVASNSMSELWSGPARIWSYLGAATLPIFTGGDIAGQVLAAEAGQREALAGYRKAIQQAFRETDDALVGGRKSTEALEAQRLQVEAFRRAARLARLKYDGGYTSYLEVLDTERSLFAAELDLSQALSAVLQQRVALLKALGGGWTDVPDRPGAAAARHVPAAH